MAERKGGNKIGNRRTNLLYHTVKRVMCNCVTCTIVIIKEVTTCSSVPVPMIKMNVQVQD